jgi:hypothetical protein
VGQSSWDLLLDAAAVPSSAMSSLNLPGTLEAFAVQRWSGNECRKHRSSRRTGTALSVTACNIQLVFNLPSSCRSARLQTPEKRGS